jgi:hypothetical protein
VTTFGGLPLRPVDTTRSIEIRNPLTRFDRRRSRPLYLLKQFIERDLDQAIGFASLHQRL